jgi:hypothetical protein
LGGRFFLSLATETRQHDPIGDPIQRADGYVKRALPGELVTFTTPRRPTPSQVSSMELLLASG